MSGWRRLSLSGVLLGVIATYAYCVAEKTYLWPFSPHPMYSGIQGRDFGTRVVMGVSAAGEFRLEGKHGRPMTPSMVRASLSGKRGKSVRRTLDTFVKLYDARRARYPDDPEYPELLGLRVYQQSWRMGKPGSALPKPRRRLLSSTLLMPEALEAEVAQQKQGTSVASVALPAGDILIEVGPGLGEPVVSVIKDARASGGVAYSVRSPTKGKPSKSPASHIDVTFDAPAGKYWLWLRGTSSKQRGQDSVWLQFDREIGTDSMKALGKVEAGGFGNWRDAFPKGVFAWSSVAPGAPAHRLTLQKAGEHRLRISAREAPAIVDQIWLSREQREAPSFSGPLTADQTEERRTLDDGL
jgi:hypothetical protein